ncbi:MAG TPA: Mur ligase family protein, partial [Cellulomonas sp.]|nr:Mur ligase family protein [Cellulomonas sp.]
MTSPARMRPAHPAEHGLAALADLFSLVTPSDIDAVRVTGVTVASTDVEPGDLFVAVPGLRVHGATYAAAAVDEGAVAVVTDEAGAAMLTGLAVPVLVAADPRGLVGPLAAVVHERPADRLATVGITGTNGKTTTTYFVDAALRAVHRVTAVMGTVELRIGDEAIESPRTTVEAPVVQSILARGLERGATAVAMEVSSHALAL